MTDKMQEAIRIGCSAADTHLKCSFPNCTCPQLPKAIRAAVEFTVRDLAKGFKVAFAEEIAKHARR